MKDILYVVLPAYNEEENIESVLKSWYAIIDGKNEKSRIIIADSGSKDKTHNILNDLQKTFSKLVVLSETGRYHGEKVIALYDYAIKSATAVAQIDYDTGAVTNVVVTCPGEGYAAGDTLTVSFVVPSKPAITAATATATLAENTAGTLRIVDGSTVSLGATFRYDGDFVMDTGTQVPITGNITLGGRSEFKGLDVRDNATLVFAGPATARDADLKGLGKIVIAEGGSLAVSGLAWLRGTVEVARTSTTPLIIIAP